MKPTLLFVAIYVIGMLLSSWYCSIGWHLSKYNMQQTFGRVCGTSVTQMSRREINLCCYSIHKNSTSIRHLHASICVCMWRFRTRQLQWIILNLDMTFPSCHPAFWKACKRFALKPTGSFFVFNFFTRLRFPENCGANLPAIFLGNDVAFLAHHEVVSCSVWPNGSEILKNPKKKSARVCWAQSKKTEHILIFSGPLYGLESAASCPNQIDQEDQANLLLVPGCDERRFTPSTDTWQVLTSLMQGFDYASEQVRNQYQPYQPYQHQRAHVVQIHCFPNSILIIVADHALSL